MANLTSTRIFGDLTVKRNIKANSIMRLDGTSVVYEDRMITAGSGLIGGGSLGGNITISHPSDGGGSIATDLTGATVVSKIVVNAAGHVTGTNTRNITLANLGYTGATNANYFTYSHPTGDGSLHVPATSTTNSGKFLMAGSSAGSLSWGTPTNTTYSVGDGGLTQKNFTTALKNKLDGIASGATVNVSTNLSATHNTTTVVINSSDGDNATINGATASAAGVVTTGNQTFGGDKTISGNLSANKVYNAVWNDIVDFVEIDNNVSIEYGKAYARRNGIVCLANVKDKGSLGIASDTYGFGVGKKDDKRQIPIAIGGFVLAQVDKVYKFGTQLSFKKNGVITKASIFTRLFNPAKIVGIFDREEKEKFWNGILVKDRHWIKVL